VFYYTDTDISVQPKDSVQSEGYRVVINTNIPVDRMLQSEEY
jgi:hypothetical protein